VAVADASEDATLFAEQADILLALLASIGLPTAHAADLPVASAGVSSAQEPIRPIPQRPAADPRKVMLGGLLFADSWLSHDGQMACVSCDDVSTNGADDGRRWAARDGEAAPLNTLTVFNAALSYQLNWTILAHQAKMQAAARQSRLFLYLVLPLLVGLLGYVGVALREAAADAALPGCIRAGDREQFDPLRCRDKRRAGRGDLSGAWGDGRMPRGRARLFHRRLDKLGEP
jgi:Di-haem cytochrome c peroxidase